MRYVGASADTIFGLQRRRIHCEIVAEGDPLYWFSVKMTARLDVNATPGGRMFPLAHKH